MGNAFLTQRQQLEKLVKQICCLTERVKELEAGSGGNFVSKAGDTMNVDADLQFSNSLTPTQSLLIGTDASELGLYMKEGGGDTTAYQIGGIAIIKAAPIERTRYLHREIYWLGQDNLFQQSISIQPFYLPAGVNPTVTVLNRQGALRQNCGVFNVVGAVGTITLLEAIADGYIIVDATDGDVIVEIPDSTNSWDGDVFTIVRIDNSAFDVTVQANNGWLISGQATILLNQYAAITVLYNAGNAQYLII